MAYTVSHLVNTVVGNQIKKVIRVTPDDTTGVVTTGLHVIEDFSVSVQSAATMSGNSGLPRFAMNELCAGTASLGSLGCTQCVSGDEYIIALYGK